MKISFFNSIRNPKPIGEFELSDILNEIKTDKYKSLVENCRNCKDKEALEKMKSKLPLFTPTGQFTHRSIAGIKNYNGIICLDLDNVKNPEVLKEQTKRIPWVYSSFVTPSGKGLKVIVFTKATVETYKQIEEQVAAAFQTLTGVQRDNHCKDIARIQYVSYDPKIYIRPSISYFVS